MTGFFDIYTYALPLFDNSISTPTYTFFNSIKILVVLRQEKGLIK